MGMQFSVFEPATKNPEVLQAIRLIEEGSFHKAAGFANSALINRYVSGGTALSREEKIFCRIVLGIHQYKIGNLENALEEIGSASGLATGDLRLQAELLLAYINAEEGNYKEAARRGSAVVSVATKIRRDVAYILDSAVEILNKILPKNRTNKKLQNKTNKLISFVLD